jgi:glyoxylate reductase
LTPEITTERKFAFKWNPVNPFEPYGQTLGIVGFGEIGKELASRAKAFGMNILYHDQHRPPEELEAELNAQYRELDDLLAESDFVSLHIPHTPATEKLINAESFERMKPTAFIINACRGGVIDEMAMVEALKTGQIAGAGLDVFVKEPLPFDHPLIALSNVVFSPHIGGGAGTGRADQRDQLHALITEVLQE